MEPLRAELNVVGKNCKVFYGETEISDCVTGLTVETAVGEITRGTLRVVFRGGVSGEFMPSEIVVRDLADELAMEAA